MKTILVVDDDERIRRILGQMLRGRGFNVVHANNAIEAHRLVTEEKQSVDLILLDINMPAVPGDILYEVLQAFHHKTKVIVCSVLPVEEQSKRVPDAADYYDKSESFGVLIQKIERALGNVRAAKKIFIIANDPHIRTLYCKLLMSAGYFPVDSGDHPEKLNFFQKGVENVDLVLLDIAVLINSGFEFCEKLRQEYPQAKVIIFNVFSEDRQKSLIYKADDYFDVSEGPKVLLEKVKHVME